MFRIIFGSAGRLSLAATVVCLICFACLIKMVKIPPQVLDADPPPLLELSVGRHGRLIMVPVQLASRERVNFLLDTGAAMSIFDVKLRSENAHSTGTTTLRTPAGDIRANLFPCPPAKIGPLALDAVGSVAYLDLELMRQASGEEFVGIVGMDFLRSYATEIDFDRGCLRLWKIAPASWTDDPNLPLLERGRVPGVEIPLGNSKREEFILDTGANVSTIRNELFDALAMDGSLRTASARTAATGGGFVRDKSGYLSDFEFCDFQLAGARFDRDPMSALGLHHLSRFRLRIDPGSQSVYLQKGQRFDQPERSATSGMAVMYCNGEKLVVSIEPDGPATEAGIKRGDVIVAVNRRKAEGLDLFELAELFTSVPGRAIELEVRRGQQHFAIRIVTRSRLAASACAVASEDAPQPRVVASNIYR